VTPTVIFDVSLRVQATVASSKHQQGIVENSISSSFSKEDWEKWLKENAA
jgi:hypothetical protein